MKKAEIARQLWDNLWEDYSRRVEYARIYQQMIEEAGGAIANDHIAFRSLRLTLDLPTGKINLGISYLASIVEALGYEAAGEYQFPDQHLYARHYRHPEQDRYDLPKLFISELVLDALPNSLVRQIEATVSYSEFFEVNSLKKDFSAAELQTAFTRPWKPPTRSLVEAVNQVSQYGAWVLLHGYAVNHFTGYINRQNTPAYPDIESTARILAQRGIPMKDAIEGSRGSGLRQTATQAVTEMVAVWDEEKGELTEIPWTYAYYEIAERNAIEIAPGKTELFQGFLNAQAKNLFEMTKTALGDR
ncbi:DUF1338 domain-containing protein [Candidatus Gracilibacteria bacterium]|nr:DUF1338 domain-containing protein [Candidatus Gracilibacteria bacterium]NJM88870.1 DUF1338 domain-containing protein [Hydrococcus sp. RU_2_2]NJP22438.1 DUF1338 domain-containing protein [Hydrococcus sp. CRU_1_1]NJQ98853.1 DUF1338 domain-containing protein [Hydrococcus sp. CSU_1_8]